MSQNCVQDMKESTNVTELRVGYEGSLLMSQYCVQDMKESTNVTELRVGYRSLLHILQKFCRT